MNADGSGQMEFYGNNSWFPTTIAHARGIPGSGKVVAIFCGHHSPQTGKLGILDVSRGRQENTARASLRRSARRRRRGSIRTGRRANFSNIHIR